MKRSLRRLAALPLLLAAARAAASPARPFGFAHAADAFAEGRAPGLEGARLTAAPLLFDPTADDPGGGAAAPVAPRRRVFDKKTTLFTGGFVLGVMGIGYLTWWRDSRGGFRFANEEWFGADTYAGGADKASHVVFSFNAEWGLESAYRRLGHPDAEARWLSVGVLAATGVLLEIGDGVSLYGASWEDEAANVFGALLSSQVSRLGLRDTIGMRIGVVKTLIPDPCCRAGINYGSDYSKEIYSLDVKLAGLLPRLGVKKPGPARFLLVSLTYDSKGFRYSPEDHQERNVGLDLGLNVPEILRAFGVRDDTWWGGPLLTALSIFRIPYTAFGFRYDLNHRRWSGWDTGDHFDPGSIFYD